MKSLFVLLIALASLLAQAQEAEPIAPVAPAEIDASTVTNPSKLGLDVSARYMYMRYYEPGLMNISGSLYGLGIGYQTEFPTGAFRAELDYYLSLIHI